MTLWDYLNNNIAVVAVIVVLGVILFFVFLVLLFRFRIQKLGPVEFRMDRKQASEFADRFLRVVEKIRELQRDITQIEEVKIIREQMRITDMALQDFLRDAKQVHLDLINARTTKENYAQAINDLDVYSLRIQIAADDVQDEIRRSFKENHFHEKNPAEFAVYVNKQLEVLFRIVEDAIDHRYASPLLPIEELRAENRKRILDYRKLLEGVYLEARDISIKYREEVAEKLDRIKTLTERYLAHDPLDDEESVLTI